MAKVQGAPDPLSTDKLRWRCDPSVLGFDSTSELEPAPGVLGQEEAVEALRFGLEIHAPGQNIYVRGLEGTGRLTTVQRLLEDIEPESPLAPDYLYVHNFDHPDRPRLITVERGRGELLAEKLTELRDYITQELASELGGEQAMARRKHPSGGNSLDALCRRYGIDNSARTRHGALLDAELLAEVYLELRGGRQANLTLVGTEAQKTALAAADRPASRPGPLPARLGADDEAAHRAAVEALGANAIWSRYGTGRD